MKLTLRITIFISLMLVMMSCVTDKQYNRAILRVETAWKEINDRTIQKDGRRFYKATKQQGFMAGQLAASRLGMVVEEQSYETGFLFFTAPAPVPLTMSEWKQVQESDTDELRSLVGEEIGIASWWVTLDPSAKDVLANIFINEKADGIEVVGGLRLRNRGPEADRVRRLQPPPTAVRIGLSKFWLAFERELDGIVADKTVPDKRREIVPPADQKPAGLSAADNPDAIAVVIGNRNYGLNVPPVDYAYNDAEAMKRFFVEGLGVKKDNVIDLRDVTLSGMEAVLGNARTHKGKLWQWIRPRESDVFIFYSGHGVPGLKGGRKYLLPTDGVPDSPEIRGYPIDLLYGNLAKLEARSITVFIEACFSGESPRGNLIRAASGIRVSAREETAPPFVVISAAGIDQMASWDKEAQHGLFTKHLLDALHGAADGKPFGNADRRISLGEIKVYLDREMTYAARRQYGREQQALIVGDPAKIIVTLKR